MSHLLPTCMEYDLVSEEEDIGYERYQLVEAEHTLYKIRGESILKLLLASYDECGMLIELHPMYSTRRHWDEIAKPVLFT